MDRRSVRHVERSRDISPERRLDWLGVTTGNVLVRRFPSFRALVPAMARPCQTSRGISLCAGETLRLAPLAQGDRSTRPLGYARGDREARPLDRAAGGKGRRTSARPPAIPSERSESRNSATPASHVERSRDISPKRPLGYARGDNGEAVIPSERSESRNLSCSQKAIRSRDVSSERPLASTAPVGQSAPRTSSFGLALSFVLHPLDLQS
jgi:hypothetical protein